MRPLKPFLLTMSLALVIVSCGNLSLDPFVGEYTSKYLDGGKLKITKENGEYYISESNGKNWSKPSRAKAIPKEELEKIFDKSCRDTVRSGIECGMGAILHVRPGSKCLGMDLPTDHAIFSIFGFLPLEKI